MKKDSSMFSWIMNEESSGRILQEIDGYYVWYPTEENGGWLNEYALTAMADYLKAKNALWNWTINHDPAIGNNQK